jgi:hypothetical protein
MNRVLALTVTGGILCLFLCLPGIGTCQQYAVMPPMDAGVYPYQAPGCTPVFPCAPPPGVANVSSQQSGVGRDLTCCDSGCGLRHCPIRLDAQVGYGHFGLDFILRPSVNFVASPDGTPNTNLCLSFTDSNVPIGSIEAGVGFPSGLFLSSRFQGSGARSVGVESREAPAPLSQGVQPSTWDGSGFQWWTLDNVIGYRITPYISTVVGLRWDKLSMNLTNPKDTNGRVLNLYEATPGKTDVTITYNCNFSSGLWVPYLGFQITGQRYRAALLWGPYAWADMKVPFRSYFMNNDYDKDIHLMLWWNYDYRCNSLKTANLLEYDFAYDLVADPRFTFQLWTRGNWMQLSWKGLFDGLYGMSQPPLMIPGQCDLDTANCTRWLISGGIGAVFWF